MTVLRRCCAATKDSVGNFPRSPLPVSHLQHIDTAAAQFLQQQRLLPAARSHSSRNRSTSPHRPRNQELLKSMCTTSPKTHTQHITATARTLESGLLCAQAASSRRCQGQKAGEKQQVMRTSSPLRDRPNFALPRAPQPVRNRGYAVALSPVEGVPSPRPRLPRVTAPERITPAHTPHLVHCDMVAAVSAQAHQQSSPADGSAEPQPCQAVLRRRMLAQRTTCCPSAGVMLRPFLQGRTPQGASRT